MAPPLSRAAVVALIVAVGLFVAAASQAVFHGTVYTEALMQRLMF